MLHFILAVSVCSHRSAMYIFQTIIWIKAFYRVVGKIYNGFCCCVSHPTAKCHMSIDIPHVSVCVCVSSAVSGGRGENEHKKKHKPQTNNQRRSASHAFRFLARSQINHSIFRICIYNSNVWQFIYDGPFDRMISILTENVLSNRLLWRNAHTVNINRYCSGQ